MMSSTVGRFGLGRFGDGRFGIDPFARSFSVISAVIFNNIFTDHWRNRWLAITEP